LPETTDIIRTVELEPKAAKLYRGLVKDSYAELGDGEITATNILTRLLRLSQLTGGYIGADAPSRCGSSKPEQVSTAKLDALADIIEEAMAENRKIVIIARFTAEIEAICKLLQSMAFRYSRIDGSIKDRAEQVSNFQNDSEVMAFVGQISTCGLGITLTSSSVMVFYSMNYSSSDFEQCKARIHRSGQTHPCSYYYIQARNTVDEKVLLALQKKADLAKSLVDDARQGRNPFE
jgi:SNF2 family DNA or RNA helicase